MTGPTLTTAKNPRRQAACRRVALRRWAAIPRAPRVSASLFPADVRLLRSLLRFRGVGPSAAFALHALLTASRGSLWEMREGVPVALPPLAAQAAAPTVPGDET